MEALEHSIVIVEDEGLIAADLQGRLERAGYRVPGVAGNCHEALDVIRDKSPDLILMDIRLQGNADGIQVAEQVRRDFDIPVVYLTAYEDPHTLERASQTQAFGYIKKPIDSASLRGSIEMAISKHRHERNLREQRDWFSSTFAALPDAVLVADGLGRICYCNPVAEELFGCHVEEALGRPATDLLRIRLQNGEMLEDLIPVVMLEAKPVAFPGDVWLEGAGGRRYAIEGSLAPRWREGRADGVVVTFKDVTLRRFEEEQSRHEDKHAALSRLAEGIAGHIDLDLSVVAEESSRLKNSLASDSTLQSAAETIEGAALDAFALTSQLRAFGQEREIKPRAIWLNEVLGRLDKAWRVAMPGLEVRIDPAPRPVHADSCEITRVLDLLLQHAYHCMDPGVNLAVGACGAELEGLREWVRIQVSYRSLREDAVGLERAFDPSWDGNWEGLPFAYGITHRMGGLLRARMEPDHKVVFEVFLPSLEIAATGASMKREDHPALLVVERNSEVRCLLRAYFEQHGYNVLEAGNCAEALLLAQSSELPIQLAIANPAIDDQHRGDLAAKLVALKAGICVRLVEGYRETAGRHLTKRELLEWANHALGLTVSAAAN